MLDKDHICRLWERGQTAGMIAARLGCSRNQVIGIIYRAGLRRSVTAKAKAVVVKPKAKPPVIVVKPPPTVVKLPTMGIDLEQLRPGMCKWPFGDGPFTFCGAATQERYCDKHKDLSRRK